MTDILCQYCDYELFANEDEFYYYITTGHKRYDRGLYYKYIINNIDLNNINKIFDYYIRVHNEKFNNIFLIVWFR